MSKLEYPPFIIGAMRLGSWGANMSTKELEVFVNGCVDLGFFAFDHVDIYGDYTTELAFGKALKEDPSLRLSIHLITKCGIQMTSESRPDFELNSYNSSASHIIASVENSLKNFNSDYIDTLLIHRPDYLMEPDEIAKAFVHLKEEGKVLHFGVSNFSTSQFELLNNSFELVTNQIEMSLLQISALENGALEQCMLKDIQPMAWSPLGGGALFAATEEDNLKRILQVTDQLCEYYNCELDELLYAWLLRHPAGIIPVTGTSKLERINSAKKALGIKLERAHWYMLAISVRPCQ